MQTKIKNIKRELNLSTPIRINELVKNSFEKIAPFWPLKNIIAVNPLQGMEDLPIESALSIGAAYFQQTELPEKMLSVNRETIKWLQAFFDEGQAIISMPNRKMGLYNSWRKLVIYDSNLHDNLRYKIEWLNDLPSSPDQAIAECLLKLSIPKEDRQEFLTLMLTTLPGWASYIKYLTDWTEIDKENLIIVTQSDYLAIRIIITTLLWLEAKSLLDWHKIALKKADASILNTIIKHEDAYRTELLKNLAKQEIRKPFNPEAQLVFCIDVRSEQFRTNLEELGNYETFGFAGFFGLPVQITDGITGNIHASCPVLIKPKHEVKEYPCNHKRLATCKSGYKRIVKLKKLYQSVKYNFTSPFALVEILGLFCGLWMGLKSLSPRFANKLKNQILGIIRPLEEVTPSIEGIPFSQQCSFAENALRMIGLTKNFAPIVIFCGHGSTTNNNAYATALDCGACGGHHGASNARILAKILNRAEVRAEIAKSGIYIPDSSHFIGAEHDTTTDEVKLYGANSGKSIQKLINDLRTAGLKNRLTRLNYMRSGSKQLELRSQDWAEVRPEWGLARNCAFIVSPRSMTSSIKLEGRCFLHSYDYNVDTNGELLATILTAPMRVAHWINMQYLFSTLDNVAYGGGSKTTKNITGKIGIMQGNASDLMTGLPLQSVYISDNVPHHEVQRLLTVVYAPLTMVDKVIKSHEVLQNLFGNGWLQIAVIEPSSRQIYFLNRDLSWQINN